jgi:predicted MFS family arabinose efflux permease
MLPAGGSTVPADEPSASRSLKTFLVLLLAYVLSQFFRAFLAIVAGDLSADLGLNAADLGSLSGIWFAAFALAQFPVGFALDRLGPRRTIGGFMLFAVAGAAGLALSRTFAGSLAAMALIGIGCAPVLMGSLYVFGRAYPVSRFAMLSSLMIGLGMAGNLLGATPLAFAVEALGWRAAMGTIAAITALSVALVFVLVHDPEPEAPSGGSGGMIAGLRDIVKIRALWILLPLSCVSYAVVIASRSLWIAPFFAEVHGLDATGRGNAALLMAIAMSLGALAYGPLERLVKSAKATTLLGSVATGLCFLALGLVGHRSVAVALALLGAIGAAGMTYGILMAHGRMFFPTHLLGRGVTFLNFAFIGGAGIVQWLSGMFVQAGREAGTPPESVFGQLHTAFGIALLAATAVYCAAPSRAVDRAP